MSARFSHFGFSRQEEENTGSFTLVVDSASPDKQKDMLKAAAEILQRPIQKDEIVFIKKPIVSLDIG